MRILCGSAQCGEYLGDVGPSAVGMKQGPVWYIRPGWRWRFPAGHQDGLGSGILEFGDSSARAEQQLIHEVFGVQRISDARVGVAREVDLPVVVRCPKCHRLRYVPPSVVTRPLIRA